MRGVSTAVVVDRLSFGLASPPGGLAIRKHRLEPVFRAFLLRLAIVIACVGIIRIMHIGDRSACAARTGQRSKRSDRENSGPHRPLESARIGSFFGYHDRRALAIDFANLSEGPAKRAPATADRLAAGGAPQTGVM